MSKLSKCNTITPIEEISKEFASLTYKLSTKEKKKLIDSLVDPIFVIMNANNHLQSKLEYFLDEETRERFYMIDRAQRRIANTILELKSTIDEPELS